MIFGPDQIRWYSYHEEEARGTKHDHEDRQMAVRWHIIELAYQFKQPRDILVDPADVSAETEEEEEGLEPAEELDEPVADEDREK